MREPRTGSVKIGKITVDALTWDSALARIVAMQQSGGTVFTPNVDHIMRAERDAVFSAAYDRAQLRLADGMPLIWASRLLGSPLPAKISGADLVPRLLRAAEIADLSVYILGGRKGAAARASHVIRMQHPRLRLLGYGLPTRVIMQNVPMHLAAAEKTLAALRPNIVLVALGSPLQELWADSVAGRLKPSVFIGVGSAVDVLAGCIKRPPSWVSEGGLEWLYRLAQEPRRLARRYLIDDLPFLGLVGRMVYSKSRAA